MCGCPTAGYTHALSHVHGRCAQQHNPPFRSPACPPRPAPPSRSGAFGGRVEELRLHVESFGQRLLLERLEKQHLQGHRLQRRSSWLHGADTGEALPCWIIRRLHSRGPAALPPAHRQVFPALISSLLLAQDAPGAQATKARGRQREKV